MGPQAHAQSYKLLALAVFVDSFKAVYMRSIHVLEEHVGSLFAVQQDFLFDPGKYRQVTGPIPLQSFHAFLASVGMKQSIAAVIKMQQNEGWQCLLEYQSETPLETSMPDILTPSKNVDLKDVPFLEQDLKVVEKAILSCYRGTLAMTSRSLHMYDKNVVTPKDHSLPCPSPSISVSSTSLMSLSDHSSDGMPALESPKCTPIHQKHDMKHKWGSDLELASAKTFLLSTSYMEESSQRPVHASSQPYSGAVIDLNSSSPVHDPRFSWNPTMMLDLNLDLTEITYQAKEPDCTLLLSTPVITDPEFFSKLELRKPSGNLQHSVTSDDSSMESFADSSSSYRNVGVALNACNIVEFNINQNAGYVCSECSVDHHHRSEINVSSAEVNGNSSTTSSVVCSPFDKSLGKSLNMEGNASGYCDLLANVYQKNAGVKRHGKQSRAKACSNGSMRSMQLWMRSVDGFKSKRRFVHPGSTSERITEITWQELSKYFSMPIAIAAKKLDIGLTAFKKRCREFQIPRWPHRKVKSINSLIGNLQDLADDHGIRSSQRVLNTVRELEEQKKLMEEMPSVELGEQTKKLRQACFKANYKKRRLGVMGNNSNDNVLHVPAPTSVLPLSASAALTPLGVMEPNPAFSTISSPRCCVLKDHFL